MAEINAVKKKAYSVLKQYKHRDLSLEDLVHLADENGFTVLDYSKTSEESDTETIIKELGLSSFAKTGNSFVYKNKDIKLIFLNEATRHRIIPTTQLLSLKGLWGQAPRSNWKHLILS